MLASTSAGDGWPSYMYRLCLGAMQLSGFRQLELSRSQSRHCDAGLDACMSRGHVTGTLPKLEARVSKSEHRGVCLRGCRYPSTTLVPPWYYPSTT